MFMYQRHDQPTPFDPFFGPFLGELRDQLRTEGSEFATGLSLFSLATSIRAKQILEIGRHFGFSTFALASALRFLDMGWTEPEFHKQRPDIDYPTFEAFNGRLTSIDPNSRPEAEELLAKYDLTKYVNLVTGFSGQFVPDVPSYDFIFIDGDHSINGCSADISKFVPLVRDGGYFILHDYYGWYEGTRNNSPIKHCVDRMLGSFSKILIDTGYMSLVVCQRIGAQVPDEFDWIVEF